MKAETFDIYLKPYIHDDLTSNYEIHIESGTCSLFLQTCPLCFKQVPGLTEYRKICSGLQEDTLR